MEYAVLGWPGAGATLDLDHDKFPFAGNFGTARTGKAVIREDGVVRGAAAFSPDRTDESTLVVRYLSVQRDRQGEGLGPRLLRFVADRATGRGFETVRIAVNNPFAYEAAYRAGFAFTGEETGMAELVLVDTDGRPRSGARYRRGLDRFADRDLPPPAAAFVDRHASSDPPDPVGSPV